MAVTRPISMPALPNVADANLALESLKERIGELQRALQTKGWHWNEIVVLHRFIDSLGADPTCKRVQCIAEMIGLVESFHLAARKIERETGIPEPEHLKRLAELACTVRFAGGPVQ